MDFNNMCNDSTKKSTLKKLIVAEKPAAGKDIAKVVGASAEFPGYMEGDNYVVTWAIGHLIGLKTPDEHDESLKSWSLESLPMVFPLEDSLKVLEGVRGQFNTVKKLIRRSDIDYLINAGDAGREGYLIQEWLYRMAGCKLTKKVLWASSLTTSGIKSALSNLHDNNEPEFQGILREAESRAEGDYFLGMNYSRLLTLTRATNNQVLSYGRCQTPLLRIIAKRDHDIETFCPKPFWTMDVVYTDGFKGVLIDEDGKAKKFEDKQQVENIKRNISSADGHVMKYEISEKQEKAPLLYNLAKLQQKMGKIYGYSPDKTLNIAQSLYESKKLLSYPRTDSQYLSMDVYEEISKHIMSFNFGKFKEYISNINLSNINADKRYFNDLKVTDHHALIPTINESAEEIYNELSQDEKNVMDAVVLSLIAIFYPEYRYDATSIIVDINGNCFKSTGTTIKDLGYKKILTSDKKMSESKDTPEAQVLPQLSEGDVLKVNSFIINDKMTTPPKKYTDETIIKAMEKYGIGTSATRAEILNKLQLENRKFVERSKDGKYTATDLGKKYISVVPKNLKALELTQNFEAALSKINEGMLSKEEFMNTLVSEFERNKKLLLSEPISEEQKIGFEKPTKIILGKCPNCGADVVSGKYGARCNENCGMNLSHYFGKTLSDECVKCFLNGKKVLIKGLVSTKSQKTYDAYFVLKGIKKNSYTKKDGTVVDGASYDFDMSFPQKKFISKKHVKY